MIQGGVWRFRVELPSTSQQTPSGLCTGGRQEENARNFSRVRHAAGGGYC